MKKIILAAGLTLAAVLNGPMVLASETTVSDEMHSEWDYSIDAVGDSNDGAIYDIQAIAVKQTPETVYVSISANFPLAGIDNVRAEDARIGWGDLFFDFTNTSFTEANSNSQLFAVKFASGTESGVAQTGVYGEVSAKSVGRENDGFRLFEEYYAAGLERFNTLGSDLVDKERAQLYYAGEKADSDVPIRNVVATGTRRGDVRFLSEAEAKLAGVDFAALDAVGDELITFAFDRDLLPAGEFMAHVFVECANDGVAIAGMLPELVLPTDNSSGGASAGGLGSSSGGGSGSSVSRLSSSLSAPALAHLSGGVVDGVVLSLLSPTSAVKNPIDSVLKKVPQEPQAVPEPDGLIGLGLFSLLGLGTLKLRTKQKRS